MRWVGVLKGEIWKEETLVCLILTIEIRSRTIKLDILEICLPIVPIFLFNLLVLFTLNHVMLGHISIQPLTGYSASKIFIG